jgi:16S rRNA (cytosine1402-N4)-methyltransferase
MNSENPSAGVPHQRRKRYAGKNPRKFAEKYKELDPLKYPEMQHHVAQSGKTPAGTHISVMPAECLAALQLGAGQCGVDATLGYGGHARKILEIIGENGFLLGLDVDPYEIGRTEWRLREAGYGSDVFQVQQSNFAGIAKALAAKGKSAVDFIFADLGCSSMQIDNPQRGFTFKDHGPVDMRLNPARGISAGEWLKRSAVDSVEKIFTENADEPQAGKLAQGLAGRDFVDTLELAREIVRLSGDASGDTTRRVFQALRIAVNDEFGALEAFLRNCPDCLCAGGRLAILTFHSGEDRRVKKAMKKGLAEGVYASISDDVIVATAEERRANPRAIPAKLRWAIKA